MKKNSHKLLHKFNRPFLKKQVILGGALCMLIVFLSVFSMTNKTENNKNKKVEPIDSLVKIDTSKWIRYLDKSFGFSIAFPPDWKLDTKDADSFYNLTKDTKDGTYYKEYSEEMGGSQITLTDKSGNVLIFAYGYAELGYPLHVFDYKKIKIAGEDVYKTYVDGCDLFIPAGYIRSGYDCRNKETKFYAIIYSDTVGNKLFDEKQYKWNTGSNSTYLSIADLKGRGATIWFNLKKPLPVNDKNFYKTDLILDKVIESLTFPH